MCIFWQPKIKNQLEATHRKLHMHRKQNMKIYIGIDRIKYIPYFFPPNSLKLNNTHTKTQILISPNPQTWTKEFPRMQHKTQSIIYQVPKPFLSNQDFQ